MADLQSRIENLVRGDDCDVIREIDNIPLGQTLTDAWLTIKEEFWDTDPILSKHVTTVSSTDGMIEDSGADTVGIIRFRLAKEDTATLYDFFEYVFDVQVKTSVGSIYTPEIGNLIVNADVTAETS